MLSQGGIGSTSEESSGNGERLINVKEGDSLPTSSLITSNFPFTDLQSINNGSLWGHRS